MKGKLISFEGIDCSGKSTLVDATYKYFCSKNVDVIKTFEPGSTPLGKEIRNVIMKGDISVKCETMLFLADRSYHLDKVIVPALESGKLVLCDRFTDSWIAYQGYARGQKIEDLHLFNNYVCNGVYPDITFCLDIDPGSLLSRKKKDRFDNEDLGFHNSVRRGYLEIAKDRKDFILLNGSKSVEDLLKLVVEICDNF